MSEIIFSSGIFPPDVPGFTPTKNLRFEYFSDLVEIPEAHLFPWVEREIVELPDPRVYRILSRAGLLVMRVLKTKAREFRLSISPEPLRTGIYCAADPGPPHYPSLCEAAEAPEDQEKSILLRRTPPKQSFRIAQNFIGAQISISHDIRGPLNTYAHSIFGSIHALAQAESDLQLGKIDRAVVCATFSLEDPLQCARLMAHDRLAIQSEAAGVVVLARNSRFTNWETWDAGPAPTGPRISYGISGPLMTIIKRSGEI